MDPAAAPLLEQAALALQQTALATQLRASAWLYPLVNLAHLLGVALLLGAITVLDLRLLGRWPDIPIDALARPLVPTAAAGLAIAVVTGPLLLSVQALEYVGNPWLAIKLAAIAAGVANIVLVHRSDAWRRRVRHERPEHGMRGLGLGLGAAISLACWLAAAAAGRMIAYW